LRRPRCASSCLAFPRVLAGVSRKPFRSVLILLLAQADWNFLFSFYGFAPPSAPLFYCFFRERVPWPSGDGPLREAGLLARIFAFGREPFVLVLAALRGSLFFFEKASCLVVAPPSCFFSALILVRLFFPHRRPLPSGSDAVLFLIDREFSFDFIMALFQTPALLLSFLHLDDLSPSRVFFLCWLL